MTGRWTRSLLQALAVSGMLAALPLFALPARSAEPPRSRALATLVIPGDRLADTFSGLTYAGHYRDGEAWTERYRDDHSLAYRDEQGEMIGDWSIAGRTFCTIYRDSPTGGCFLIVQSSRNCFEFYFVARLPDEAALVSELPAAWDARGWRTDLPSTCTGALTS